MKQFKGHIIYPGTYKGKAVVTHQGFNTLASFQKSLLFATSKKAVVSDQNNPELFGKNITGIALCLPMTIGSTTGGMVIETASVRNLGPKAWLFSEPIDSLAASGLVLANSYNGVPLIAIDRLGKEFLETVKTGGDIEIKEDGTVVVY